MDILAKQKVWPAVEVFRVGATYLKPADVLWRARVGSYDDRRKFIFVEAMCIISRTRCGVWIDHYGRKRFVLNDARKRYAYPTENEAIVACLHRLSSRISHLEARLDEAVAIREAINNSFKWTL